MVLFGRCGKAQSPEGKDVQNRACKEVRLGASVWECGSRLLDYLFLELKYIFQVARAGRS